MSKAITPPKTAPAMVAIAACSMALTSGTEIQLTPAGEFRAFDGRPVEAKAWRMNASLAQPLIAAAAARPTPYVLDYEHQTLRAATNGQPAPAAGWFHKLEWRDGIGLFGIDVKWTAAATAMIDAGEYKFISPVIAYNDNGDVTGLLMAAVTNNPAILGMDEILTAAATMQYTASLNASPTQELPNMKPLIEKLIWLLGLPADSADDAVLAAVQKLTDTVKDGQGNTAAASGDLINLLTTQRSQIASLSAAAPDPAKYVPVSALTALHSQVAALNAQIGTQTLDSIIQAGLDAGKLLPSMESWAREFGAQDTAALSGYINALPVIAALNGTQTNGQPPAKTAGKLSESQVALCAAMGVSQTDYLATLAAEPQA